MQRLGDSVKGIALLRKWGNPNSLSGYNRFNEVFMEISNQTPADREHEEIRGKIPGLDETPEPEGNQEENQEQKPEEKVEEKPQGDEQKPDHQEEEKKPDDEQKPEPAPEEGKKEEDTQSRTPRPEKYIPIAKYTSEKTQWKKDMETLQARLAVAEQGQGEQAKEQAIKAYAEKHNVSEDSVRDLLDLAGKKDQKSEEQGERIMDTELQQKLEEADEIRAEKLFNTEYDEVAIPELKKIYPKATDAQIQAAKKEIEKLACTEGFLDKPLDFVVYKNPKVLDPLFQESPPPRKGPETGRTAPKRGDSEYTAADFVGGKTSFAEFEKLPVDKQAEIIEKMDVKTYDELTRWQAQNEPLVINRGGRKIRQS